MRASKIMYQDKKWNVINNKTELSVSCRCNCGLEHDISFDGKGEYVGSGTDVSAITMPKKKVRK